MTYKELTRTQREKLNKCKYCNKRPVINRDMCGSSEIECKKDCHYNRDKPIRAHDYEDACKNGMR